MYLPLTPLILCYLPLSLRIFKVKAKQYFTLCLADQLLKTVVFFYLCLKQKTKRKRPGKTWCVQCIGSILMPQCFRVSCHIMLHVSGKHLFLTYVLAGSELGENNEIQPWAGQGCWSRKKLSHKWKIQNVSQSHSLGSLLARISV